MIEVIEIIAPAPEIVTVEAMPVVRVDVATPGPQGPAGPAGPSGDGAADPGDLTLIFDNRLV
jgi:hypothetical protein